MRRARWLLLLLVPAGIAWFAAPPAPSSAPRAPARPVVAGPIEPGAARSDEPAAVRADRVRQVLVADVVADGALGAMALDAMAQDGDSDPRLLRALVFAGIRPSSAVTTAAALDPWLGVALLDLDRQVADRCDCGWTLDEPAAELIAAAADPRVACVVDGVVGRDERRCDPR